MKVARFTRPLSVGLEPEVYARIQQITDKEKISMAEWIRNALVLVLNERDDKEGSRQ